MHQAVRSPAVHDGFRRRDDARLDALGRRARRGTSRRAASTPSDRGLEAGQVGVARRRCRRRRRGRPGRRSPRGGTPTQSTTMKRTVVVVDWSQVRQSPTENTSPTPVVGGPLAAVVEVLIPAVVGHGPAVLVVPVATEVPVAAVVPVAVVVPGPVVVPVATVVPVPCRARSSWSRPPSRRPPGSPCPAWRRDRSPRHPSSPRAPPPARRRPARRRRTSSSARQHDAAEHRDQQDRHEGRQVEHARRAAASAAAGRAAVR